MRPDAYVEHLTDRLTRVRLCRFALVLPAALFRPATSIPRRALDEDGVLVLCIPGHATIQCALAAVPKLMQSHFETELQQYSGYTALERPDRSHLQPSLFRHYDEAPTLLKSQPRICAIGADGNGMAEPAMAFGPISINPGDPVWYDGEMFSEWRGDLFVPSFNDGLLRLHFDGAGHPQIAEKLIEDLQQRLRAVAIGPDGDLYILTDETQGVVFRVSRAD